MSKFILPILYESSSNLFIVFFRELKGLFEISIIFDIDVSNISSVSILKGIYLSGNLNGWFTTEIEVYQMS